MSKMTVTRRFHVRTEASGRQRVRPGPEPAAERVPRVAKLMALAICFDQMIREGVVADQAELARLGRVTRARLTQIMNLLNLSPAIQESVLQLPPEGRARRTERELRPIAARSDWRSQQRQWTQLQSKTTQR